MVTCFLQEGLTEDYISLLRTREEMHSDSGPPQRVLPPTSTVWCSGKCFPALEPRQRSLPRSSSDADVVVGEGASAPAR